MYPSLSKYEDPARGVPNYPGARPYPVCKLGETYLLAAEAAMQTGREGEAMELINVIKRRAANRPGLSAAEVTERYNVIRLTSPCSTQMLPLPSHRANTNYVPSLNPNWTG